MIAGVCSVEVNLPLALYSKESILSARRSVNNAIRRKLRQIRKRKGLGLAEISSRAGMPLSSYACMEAGHYAISLENLSRILSALEVDIGTVWPHPSEAIEQSTRKSHSVQVQRLRLEEVLSLSGAQAGALVALEGDQGRLLLEQGLEEEEATRIVDSLARRVTLSEGICFGAGDAGNQFVVFLRTKNCPDFVRQLIRHYLIIWMRVFE